MTVTKEKRQKSSEPKRKKSYRKELINCQFRKDTYAERILLALAMSGEYPVESLRYLQDHYKDVPTARRQIGGVVTALKRGRAKKQYDPEYKKYRAGDDTSDRTHKDFVTPYISERTIEDGKARKTKKTQFNRLVLLQRGTTALKELYPDFYDFYMFASDNEIHRTEPRTILRMMRFSEIMQWIYQAHVKIKFLFSEKPDIRSEEIKPYTLADNEYLFYTSREIKQAFSREHLKIDFTRLHGAIVSKKGVIPVFHTYKGLILWKTQGEQKAQVVMKRLFYQWFGIESLNPATGQGITDAIFFGVDFEAAKKITNSKSNRKTKKSNLAELDFEFMSLSETYQRIFFLPMQELKTSHISMALAMNEDLNKRLIQVYGQGHPMFKHMPDATKIPGGVYADLYAEKDGKKYAGIFSLDGELQKIKMAHQMAYMRPHLTYVFFATPSQKKYIDSIFKNNKKINYQVKVVDENKIMKILNLKKGRV